MDPIPEDDIIFNAKKFSETWKDATSEKSEAQTFINEFYEIFGKNRKTLANFEEHPADTPDFIDCIEKGKFMIEMKSTGKNLYEAMEQALGYYAKLKADDLPRYILACDFQNWHLLDKQDNSLHIFTLDKLADNVGLFGFMTGRPKVVNSDPVNNDAVIMISKIFAELKQDTLNSGEISYFLTRVVFCLFADDMGIFEKGIFQERIKNTAEDSSDTGQSLKYLFDNVLSKHRDERFRGISPTNNKFPYIDGDLFVGEHIVPDFTPNMRELLIEAGEYDWSKVSPAIFGSMFQTVMDQGARHETGSHYTTEENILKVIRPLFLDELNAEFDDIDRNGGGSKKLKFIKFHEKLASLKFLDPACGSGNFLVVTYREIRRLEHRVIVKIHGFDGKKFADELSKIDVNQFYGIELVEFSSKIAQVSLWMMDHMMNVELTNMVDGYRFRRIPIQNKPNIVCRDALEFDWNELLPNSECSYILGNPPFGGSKKTTKDQREQVKKIAGDGLGTLDYVTAWFIKGARYIKDVDVSMAFVSTNSITQGEQVSQLWPIILETCDLEIIFAHRQFKWGSETPGMAQVTVVIVGLGNNVNNHTKSLFHYDRNGAENITESPQYISPYLFGSEDVLPIVKKENKPINGLPKMRMGSKPIDGGNYIFTDEEKEPFLAKEPGAEEFLKPYINADEFLNGESRSILALHDIEPNVLRELPEVKARMKKVKNFRKKSSDAGTRELANSPKLYHLNVIPTEPFLLVPSTTSEKREYVPLAILEPPIIPSNATMIVENVNISLFGLLSSKMHMVWLKAIGGKLETRFRYSAGMVYNTFPVPEDYSSLENHAQKILDVRKTYHDSTLADLYDPLTMPDDLKKAHRRLDRKVEKLYRKKSFTTDEQRLEFLLEKYKEMTKSNQETLKPE